MNEIITEKKYPVKTLWLFKQLIGAVIVLPILLIYFFFIIRTQSETGISGASSGILVIFLPYILIFGLALCVPVIIRALQRANFHYSLEDTFMVLHQGIISKQNRNVPYGRIQGVFVNQGLFDRIFGLASLTFEDYSQGGRSSMSVDGYVGSGKSRHEIIGFVGNKIHIPGMKKDDAEALKAAILQKVKEHPIEDSQSGL